MPMYLDGNRGKRRGPKPDSKPALTRRQELNRQAQRTHRERKEQYIKALEDEVLRLKEVYATVSNEKTAIAQENHQLRKQLAQQSGPGSAFGTHDDTASSNSFSPGAAGSNTGYSNTTAYTPPSGQQQQLPPQGVAQPLNPNPEINYEHAGVQFVLQYDDPSSKAYLSPPHQ